MKVRINGRQYRSPFGLALLALLLISLQLACSPLAADKEKSGAGAVPASASISPLADHLAALSWLADANVERDVQAFIARQDYRLLAQAGRGSRILGLAPALTKQLQARCGLRLLPGSTDAVRDDQHLHLLKKAQRYGEAYNQLMVKHCLVNTG